MTPQERHLIDDLFDRLSSLETSPRDPDAERAIIDGLRRAPNATYALVQTALVQDEALKRANARIEELEGTSQGSATSSGSFLNSMREAVFGSSASRGSVPNVRSDTGAPRSVWNNGAMSNPGYPNSAYPNSAYPMAAPAYSGSGFGGSFLGTAAAAAAGTIGGAMLMNGTRGLMGGGGHQAFGDTNGLMGNSSGSSSGPWGGDQSNSNLARDAGIGDVGGGASGGSNQSSQNQGFFDNASTDGNDTSYNDDGDDFDGDDFGGDGGNTDFA